MSFRVFLEVVQLIVATVAVYAFANHVDLLRQYKQEEATSLSQDRLPKPVKPGFTFKMPTKDVDGDDINLSQLKLVVAMPSCAACTSRTLSKKLLSKYSSDEVFYMFPNSEAVLLSESDQIEGKLCLSVEAVRAPIGFFDSPPRAFALKDGVLSHEVTEHEEIPSMISKGDLSNANKQK